MCDCDHLHRAAKHKGGRDDYLSCVLHNSKQMDSALQKTTVIQTSFLFCYEGVQSLQSRANGALLMSSEGRSTSRPSEGLDQLRVSAGASDSEMPGQRSIYRSDRNGWETMPLSSRTSRSAAEQSTVIERLSKGSRIVVAPSAGPRLAGKHGVVVGNGATTNQVRVRLDSSKHCITLHARFLGPEAEP